MVETVGDREFSERVLGVGNVLVSFRGAGCISSLALEQVIESVASRYEGRVATVAVDVDRSTAISRRFQVNRIPLTMMFSSGKVVDFIGGLTTEENLSEMVERRLEPVIDISDRDFSLEVLEWPLPTIVHFGAAWCDASLRMLPELREVGERFRTRAKVARIEVGPATRQLCAGQGVFRVPTTTLFVGGRIQDQIFGRTSAENITSMLTQVLL
jgi:thioredoxin 1